MTGHKLYLLAMDKGVIENGAGGKILKGKFRRNPNPWANRLSAFKSTRLTHAIKAWKNSGLNRSEWVKLHYAEFGYQTWQSLYSGITMRINRGAA